MTYDALILDNDGVIVTPTAADVWISVNWMAFKEYGVEPDRKHVTGLDNQDADGIRALATKYDLDPERFWTSREQHAIREQREAIRAGQKVRYKDVETLPKHIDIGIVSNNQQPTIDFIVDHFGLAEYVNTHYGRDPDLSGLARKKPNPHYLERGIKDLKASNPLFVGDSNVDIAAANAAGIDSAFLRRSHRGKYTLQHEPTYEIQGLEGVSNLFEKVSNRATVSRSDSVSERPVRSISDRS